MGQSGEKLDTFVKYGTMVKDGYLLFSGIFSCVPEGKGGAPGDFFEKGRPLRIADRKNRGERSMLYSLNSVAFDKNAAILYVIVGIIIAVIMAQAIFFLVRSYRRGLAIGMEKSVLNKTIFRSAIFTIAPAIAILVGVVGLSNKLGIPLPWLRLSVIGSLSYETIASGIVSAVTDADTYVSVALVMTMGMIVSMFLPSILGKKINNGMIKIKQKDKRWGDIFMTSLFLGMISAFLGYVFGGVCDGWSGFIPVFVFLVSAVLMALCGLLLKVTKWKWINDYALPVCMILGMLSAIPLTMWLG